MRHPIVICALVSALTAALCDAPPAAAGCVAAVVVDGRVLFGHGNIAAAHLPRIGNEHRAVEPACNDAGQDELDRPISVLTLEGIPPHIAVVRRGHPTGLYVADGSLVVSAAHPLRRAMYRTNRRSARRRTCRRESDTVEGTLAEPLRTGSTLALRSGKRTVVIEADVRTRLTNRPPYESLNLGQRLTVRTSFCGSRRLADTIAFNGATVHPDPYETDTGDGIDLDPRWMVAAAWVAVMVALLLAARRLGRASR